jgi:uncharacterized protein (UPF0305 family)
MDYELFYKELLNLTQEDSLSKNELLELLKSYSNRISVFDLMNLITLSDSTFEGVSQKWRELGNKMQVETFVLRIKTLTNDQNIYEGFIDKEEYEKYVSNLKDTLDLFKSLPNSCIIVILSILYANYILEEPVHPEGTEFPGSQKVVKKDGLYYCPAKEGNLENPNAFCRLCIAEQL